MSKSILNQTYSQELQKKWESWSQHEKIAYVRQVLAGYPDAHSERPYIQRQLDRLEDGKDV